MIIGEGPLINSDYIYYYWVGGLPDQGISWEQPGPDFLESEVSILGVWAVEFTALGRKNPNQSGLACSTEPEYSPKLYKAPASLL